MFIAATCKAHAITGWLMQFDFQSNFFVIWNGNKAEGRFTGKLGVNLKTLLNFLYSE